MDQPPQDPNSKNSLNLDNILLPKKDAPSVDSAQRVDAGTLLNQEQSATLAKPQSPEPAQNSSIGAGAPRESSASASAASPVTQENIAPLQTYQGDIANTIGSRGVSVVSIAAAEATRRGTQPVSQDEQLGSAPEPHTLRNIVFALIGLVLVASAVGALGYIIVSQAPLQQQAGGVAPFIAVDSGNKVSVPAEIQGLALMQQLVAAKNSVSLSLGLVDQLYIEQSGTSTASAPTFMSAQTLFSLLAPDMSDTLLRNIAPVYLLGVHSFGVNQPFLILKVASYEQGYAGMLAWEGTMKKDLSPLFTYVPAPKIKTPVQAPVTTATSTTATSTAATSTVTVQAPPLQTGFIDAIVNNHDARVTEDQYGTINFLWTFLDRQTLVITTNPDTLREIISRLNQAPILSQPTAR